MTRIPRTVSAVLVALLVILGGGVAVSLGASGQTDTAAETQVTDLREDAQSNESQANVTFDDQQSDGRTVVVSSVTVPEGGFVAIHDQSLLDGDAIGSVLGNSVYLEPGTHENVTVTLARPIEDNATLIAMPHKDTNENRVYDFVIGDGAVDGPYTADDQAVVDDARVLVEEGERPTQDGQLPEQLVFHVESLSIAEWSFVVGDSTDPDRTEIIRNLELEDETVRLNATALLRNESMRDVVQRERGVSQEDAEAAAKDAQKSAEKHDATVPSDLDTVRVVLRDITVQNVTFVVELPQNLNVSEMPGQPGIPEQPQQLDANVTFENQTSDGETVTIDSVTMSEGGFVTLHNRSLLDGNVVGSVVGSSEYLEPGTHENVTVTLDEPLTESQPLIAMPHLDTNGNQQYDFVASGGAEDLPYVVNGEVVVDPALVRVEGGAETTAETTTTTTAETTTAAEETTTPAETTAAEETTTTPEETTTAAEETTTTAETTTAAREGGQVQTVSDLGPSLAVEGSPEAPLNATVGETLVVNATVTNPTESELTQPVDYRLEGAVLQRQNVTLGPGESTNVTFEIDTSNVDPGTYTHGVYTRNFGRVSAITLEAAGGANQTTTANATTTTTAKETTTAAEETTTAAEETTTTAKETTTAADGTTVAETTAAETTPADGATTTAAETTTEANATTAGETTTA
ncbi:DUF7282 domain-containing protein [Haladaptatus salinisoli]|uniref:DUF7282 domain-containing protein n=1 Tax=Haladaptatus salinisoli TaxID=2884876 RepID=UPI001D0B5CE7|nr:hypothetical protein [Haladaptatus salinisoli]